MDDGLPEAKRKGEDAARRSAVSGLTRRPRIIVSAPHQEVSTLVTARAASQHGHLVRFYTTLHTASFRAAAARIPHRAVRDAVDAQLRRRSFSGVPSDLVRPVAQLPQAMQVLSMRIPRANSLASWLREVECYEYVELLAR
jgi:hypothetical protein